jgi:hypothetical protein
MGYVSVVSDCTLTTLQTRVFSVQSNAIHALTINVQRVDRMYTAEMLLTITAHAKMVTSNWQ